MVTCSNCGKTLDREAYCDGGCKVHFFRRKHLKKQAIVHIEKDVSVKEVKRLLEPTLGKDEELVVHVQPKHKLGCKCNKCNANG